jgi:acetoin utilization protein AcuB
MILEKIMTRPVVTVELDDSVRAIKQILDVAPFHHLLVQEDGILYGVITDRDVFKALSPNIGTPLESARDAATLNKRAHQIMTRKPWTLPRTADVFEAIYLFNHRGIACVPVVDANNRIEGIVTTRDIFRLLEANKHRFNAATNASGESIR